MNKERLYKHNGYGFGYDSDFKDGSCLTIVKSKKDTLEVLTNIFGESANAINGILENQQQELERYKNIIDELEKWLVLQRDNLDKRVSEMKSDDKNMTRANHYTFIYNRVIDRLKNLKENNNI